MSDTVRFNISICCSTLPNNSVVMLRSPAAAGAAAGTAAGAAADADDTYCDIDGCVGCWCMCGGSCAYAAVAGKCLGGTDIEGSLPNDAVSVRGAGSVGGIALRVGMLCLCSVTLGSFSTWPPAVKSYEAPACELALLYDCRASSSLLSESAC